MMRPANQGLTVDFEDKSAYTMSVSECFVLQTVSSSWCLNQ